MNESFLYKVAKELVAKHVSLSNVCIVLPNRRAGLFLKENLAEVIGKNFISPDVFTIEEFISKFSSLNYIDPIEQIFKFYKIYQNSADIQNKDDFDRFYQWASIILKDLDEIDFNLVDYNEIFGLLSDYSELKKWAEFNLKDNNEDNSELESIEDVNYDHSVLRKDFSTFFKEIKPICEEFILKLKNDGHGTKGMIFRDAVKNIEKTFSDFLWDNINLIGFNALTCSEKEIFKLLINAGIAHTYWDIDSFYYNNPIHEAGMALREIIEDLKISDISFISDSYKNPKRIDIYGIAGNTTQALFANQILSSFKGSKNSFRDTAVVLCDESLVLSVISGLPDNIQDANVTLGYPLNKSPFFEVTKSVFEIFDNANKLSFKSEMNSNIALKFYHKDLLRLLFNPILQKIWNHERIDFNAPTKKLIEGKQTFFSPDEVISIFPLKDLLNIKKDDDVCLFILKTIQNICNSFVAIFDSENEENINYEDSILIEHARYFNEICILTSDYLKKYNISLNIATLMSFVKQTVYQSRLSFSGEPLKGLQIMGMLETRLLDFKNVIIVSVNEGIIPKGKSDHSFIPMMVKQFFKLTTYHQRDSIYAYHFYRLLQRAENISIIYNTEISSSGKERSRFIEQLVFELPLFNKNITLNHEIVDFSESITQNFPIKISKTEAVIEKLKSIEFSQTSIYSYYICPLKFYFRYILGIEEEKEEAGEYAEMSDFGTVIHNVLKKIIEKYGMSKEFNAEKIIEFSVKDEVANDIVSAIPQMIIDEFKDFFNEKELSFGRNYLMIKVAEKLLENYINKIRNKILVIKALELELKVSLTVDGIELNIKGKIDRIDVLGCNQYLILDYKTGKWEENDIRCSDKIDYKQYLSKKPYVFQLLFYSFLFQHYEVFQHKSISPNICAGIIPLRFIKDIEMGCSLMNAKNLFMPETEQQSENSKKDDDKKQNECVINRFSDDFGENIIKRTLSNMMDRDIEFSQTEDTSNCKHCDYSHICRRTSN